ncbi:NADH-quinone oxidoreductase subunit L [bacterium]|nr:NADH-quinone oxidoreductase subunit L [bacterium]
MDSHTTNLLLWVPLLPLLGAIINGFLTLFYAKSEHGAPKGLVSAVAVGAPLLAFFVSLKLFFELRGLDESARLMTQHVATWIQAGQLNVGMDFMLDPLSAVMILMVTFIGTLIHLYSVGYMSHDRGFSRYFTYLNLFTFSMLVLVLGKNLPMMFVGWEGVGVCSYLLIGFWYSDILKANAGNKAFITNRVGDFGFLLGIFFLFVYTMNHGGATLDFVGLKAFFEAMPKGEALTITVATTAALLLFIGAMGKSAQVPLHVWLADAMAGPTPVSALIHAATMVTAGVYMVARCNFIFGLSPLAQTVVASIGALTALFAASIALTQSDIKRVLAYSTLSQLGYMFVGVGIGAYSTGMFHVFTHAFFKALLFLGAGSVIHAMHEEQNLWKMGGLKAKMPITFATMGIATLAIAGIPPFAGFFSKDEILLHAFAHQHYVIYGVLLLTAAITAYYMFRMFFLAFYGTPRDKHRVEHAHESPWVMTLPLVVLCAFTVFVGFLGLPHIWGPNLFGEWLAPVVGTSAVHVSLGLEYGLMGLSVLVAVIGISIAYARYGKATPATEPTRTVWWEVLKNKYYIDEFYDAVLIKPLRYMARVLLNKGTEENGIDKAVNEAPRVYASISGAVRTLQNGLTRSYALMMLVGAAVIAVYYILKFDTLH